LVTPVRTRWFILALGALIVDATSADAQFRLRVEDLGIATGVVVTDNATGDSNPTVGVITFVGAVGNFTINVTTGVSKPVIGGSGMSISELDLNSVNVAAATGVLQLVLQDTGYGGPDGTLDLDVGIGGVFTAPGGPIFQSWVNPANAVPALGPDQSSPGLLPALGGVPVMSVSACAPAFAPGTGAFSTSCSTTFTKSGPYSLFTIVLASFTGAGSLSFDELLTVPTLPNGATCDAAGDCDSGFCADGVCCNIACTDPRLACNVPANLGTCTLVGTQVPVLSVPGLLVAVLVLGIAGALGIARRRGVRL
jgi:hypothetical protein